MDSRTIYDVGTIRCICNGWGLNPSCLLGYLNLRITVIYLYIQDEHTREKDETCGINSKN